MSTFVEALLSGAPLAILAALVGVIWEFGYKYVRDKLQDAQAKRAMELEQQKFRHQQELEKLRFGYEQQRWREELGREITIKLLEARITEYNELWKLIEEVSLSKRITPDRSKQLAQSIRQWRYSKGGFIAEPVTRDAALTFQKALWRYEDVSDGYSTIRRARALLIQALRTDIGLADNAQGRNIYDILEERQNIRLKLDSMQKDYDLDSKER